MQNILKSLLKDSKNSSCCEKWLWQKIKKWNAAILQLSKKEKIELRRQMWTTYTNLNDWFDAWQAFVIKYGFATQVSAMLLCFNFLLFSLSNIQFLFRMKMVRLTSQMQPSGELLT